MTSATPTAARTNPSIQSRIKAKLLERRARKKYTNEVMSLLKEVAIEVGKEWKMHLEPRKTLLMDRGLDGASDLLNTNISLVTGRRSLFNPFPAVVRLVFKRSKDPNLAGPGYIGDIQIEYPSVTQYVRTEFKQNATPQDAKAVLIAALTTGGRPDTRLAPRANLAFGFTPGGGA